MTYGELRAAAEKVLSAEAALNAIGRGFDERASGYRSAIANHTINFQSVANPATILSILDRLEAAEALAKKAHDVGFNAGIDKSINALELAGWYRTSSNTWLKLK